MSRAVTLELHAKGGRDTKFLKHCEEWKQPHPTPSWNICPGLLCGRKINCCVCAMTFQAYMASSTLTSSVEYQQFHFLRKSVCARNYLKRSRKICIKTYLYDI